MMKNQSTDLSLIKSATVHGGISGVGEDVGLIFEGKIVRFGFD